MITWPGCSTWPTGPARSARRATGRRSCLRQASPHRRDALTRLAAQGMTVLANRDSALPLARDGRIALIGRHAIKTICMGGGSAQVNPPHQVSIAEGLRALLGDAVTLTDGVEVRQRPVAARPGFVVDPDTSQPGTQLIRYTADGHLLDRSHHPDSATIVGYDSTTEDVARLSFRARIAATGMIEVGVMGVGQWTLRVGERTEHILLQASGSGIGEEILTPPSAVVSRELLAPVLVEASVRRPRAAPGNGADGPALYALIAHPAARAAEAAMADAERAAAEADIAVVVVGLTDEQETETVNKTTLRLPGRQDELVRKVAAAAQRTVVVVNAATPVLMPWLEEVNAVLWAGLPGQEGGHAVAAALLGDIEPAGRLVTTFPTADGAAPAWSVTPVDGELTYAEGTFIGYRGHYSRRAPAPAFWFGHGLGYSTWDYPAAELLPGDGSPGARVQVINTGGRRSREVVQLYLQPAEPEHPVRLVGWAALTADPGEARSVDVTTDARLWRYWDPAAGRWGRLSGGQIIVARGLGDIRHVLDL